MAQSFYSLEQATQYLNIKYGDNYFTPASLLQAFIQHTLPCYFFFKNSDAMPFIEPEFSITSDASDEDLNLAGDVNIPNSGSFFDEIDWRLSSEIRDNGLLLQLPQSALVQALICHATIDNNPPNCFCGALAFNPELSTYQDFNIYMENWIFKKYGKTIKFTFNDLTMPIKLTTTTATDTESLRFYVTQDQIQKQHPQIVAFFAEYPKPNGETELHPTFKISASDLTVLHRDLEQIENTVNDNMATPANELDGEIASPKDQLEQKEQEIASLQAKNTLSPRREQNYLITIGILLELCQTKTFTSQNQIINTITEQSIYGQGERILQDRFAKAIKAIDQARKARKK